MADYNKIASGISSGISGTTQLVGGAMQLAQVHGLDDEQQNLLDNKKLVGLNNYTSFNQAFNDYNSLNYSLDLNLEKIRGVNDFQKVGGVLSSAATGAATGAAVGGPWGALAGAIVGTGAGLTGVFIGNNKAKRIYDEAEVDDQLATIYGKQRADYNLDNYIANTYNLGIAHRKEDGGDIQKSKGMIRDFAGSISGASKRNERSHAAGVIREHVKGGTRIRIKR